MLAVSCQMTVYTKLLTPSSEVPGAVQDRSNTTSRRSIAPVATRPRIVTKVCSALTARNTVRPFNGQSPYFAIHRAFQRARAVPSAATQPHHGSLLDDVGVDRSAARRESAPMLSLPSDDRLERHQKRGLVRSPLVRWPSVAHV